MKGERVFYDGDIPMLNRAPGPAHPGIDAKKPLILRHIPQDFIDYVPFLCAHEVIIKCKKNLSTRKKSDKTLDL
ncbi:MAG: hypothetical protein EHM45_06460 [Desulfobacteraceae bacterium]|nr:MAG: hypothetical protein EHM45_06460 [Desulfobacteraceae bacterium]